MNRKIILAVKGARAPTDDLLKLDHGLDRSHQHDVAHVAGVHPGGELARSGQYGRYGLLVVLKLPELFLAHLSVPRGHPSAIVRVRAVGQLVDQVAHRQGMDLRGAKYDRLFPMVDRVEEDLDPFLFALLDCNEDVEVLLHISLARFHLPILQVIVLGEDVIVHGSGNLIDPKRRKEPVVDSLLERIDVDRLAEVVVGIRVLVALRGGRQAQLHSG